MKIQEKVLSLMEDISLADLSDKELAISLTLAEVEKIIDDFFDEDDLYFRMEGGIPISCNKILADKIKQKLKNQEENES